MDEEIKCERCHKKIKEFLWFSRIDHKIICRKCNDKEQPKELMKQIADLEAKLAEKEKEPYLYDEGGDALSKKDVADLLNRQNNEIKKLENELAEKEKEETKRMEDFEKGCQEYYSSDKYKKDFAIAELEQLKHDIWTNQHDDGWLDEQVDIYELTEMIDQQIKSLKGEK